MGRDTAKTVQAGATHALIVFAALLPYKFAGLPAA